MASHAFQADVQQLLHLVTHALYSEREVFLRELISNASDALDRARFAALEDTGIRPATGEPSIRIAIDDKQKTITISDDGIGLTEEEALQHLGTIARSGTRAFADAVKTKGDDASTLVGQFGVGFYASFMVAERVVVRSLSATKDARSILWSSEGAGSFEIAEGDRSDRGTDVILHIRDDASEFLDADRLREIIQQHSDFIQWPIEIDKERANQESALWTRSPNEISEEDYSAFYKHISHDWNDPITTVHTRVEGNLTFDALLFIPSQRSWQLDQIDHKVGLRLYQKRVKVIEAAGDLLPRYLRFVCGVVDTPDVSLNISREILQQTPTVRAIKRQLTKRILKKLGKLASEQPETYSLFWAQFGHVLKEGIQEDPDNRALLVELLRFKTTRPVDDLPTSEGTEPVADETRAWRSLATIKADMGAKQESLWYLTDVNSGGIERSPMLERFRAQGIEVMLLTDPVDEWVMMHVQTYEDTPLKSAAHGELPTMDEDGEDPISEAAHSQATPLATWMSELLNDEVAEVRVSKRLTDSPSVLVNQQGAMGANMERILAAAQQSVDKQQRVLEINPDHPMVQTLARLNGDGKTGIEPFARLLLDHATIIEGRITDPSGFAQRLQTLMDKAAEAL
jgi:molecular chaperone HtpG